MFPISGINRPSAWIAGDNSEISGPHGGEYEARLTHHHDDGGN
jgi:hypothetical protein